MSDEKQFETVFAHKQAVKNVSNTIMSDPKERAEFLADPKAYLQKAAIPVAGHIELTERDRSIINMVADPTVATLYHSGNLAQLAAYFRGNYPSLINDPTKVAWTVADFEVAIEALAVAVGIAVAAVQEGEDFSEMARLETVHSARLDAVDARLAELEAKVRSMGGSQGSKP